MKGRYVGLAVLVMLTVWVVLSTVSFAQAPTELPPRVIECSPKPFATNVDPKIQQITITFDRPMNKASAPGFGALRFAGVYPAPMKAQPTWDATGTICSLPVTLEPDVTYAVAVNSSKQRTFVDDKGIPALGFAWAFATGERAAEDFPAYVVKSDPPLGAKEADFRKQEITVTFSRPVAPGDFSWVLQRGSGEYPGAREGEAPRLSTDRLTATLEVRLSPNTVYALGVNDVFYYGYKDIKGRPALPFGLCFKTAP